MTAFEVSLNGERIQTEAPTLQALLQDGVWHINGLYRHGYLCAPALVESLMQKMLEPTP